MVTQGRLQALSDESLLGKILPKEPQDSKDDVYLHKLNFRWDRGPHFLKFTLLGVEKSVHLGNLGVAAFRWKRQDSVVVTVVFR